MTRKQHKPYFKLQVFVYIKANKLLQN